MQPRYSRPKRRSFGASSQSGTTQFLLGLPILAMVIVLTLTTLACAFIGTGWWLTSNRVAVHTRLPTLTHTPLPTLTPTVNSSSQAGPMSAEVAVAPPTLTPTPIPALIPAFTPASNDLAAVTSTEGSNDDSSMLTAVVGLNVRTGPGVDYPIVGKLAQGQSTPIIGKNPEGTWWQIVHPPGSGSLAWVSADAQYSTASNSGAVQIAQLPSPPPPTATPTSAPAAPPTQIPAPTTGAPIAQLPLTPVPTGSSAAQPIATPVSGSSDWDFTGVRLYPNQYEDSLVLYGNVVNNTGSLQELLSITGTFYDAQGQVVAGPDSTHAYWPGYVVPAGSSLPFELFVNGTHSIARFDLIAEAEPSSENPRQDFEFAEVGQGNDQGAYCLKGELRVRGDKPEDYLIIAAVLYDGQGNVVNFGDYSEFGVDDDEVDFEICINPPNQEVARYELRAWGL